MKNYSYKPDWDKAQKRWDAFWALDSVDRPCISVKAPRPDGKKITLPKLNSIKEKWLSPEYQLTRTLSFLEENYFGGEAVPLAPHSMSGTTTGCGEHLHFSEGGISLRPTMQSIDDPLNWYPGPQDPWRPQVDAIYNLLLDNAPGNYIVAPPMQFRHLDLLNMLRGNSETMMDMAMNPDQVKKHLHAMRPLSAENEDHFNQLLHDRQGDIGKVSWTGVWGRKHFAISQADAAACISPEMFEEFVLPELDYLGERYERLWYHTCGYKQHLELYLNRPYMKVIQYSTNLKEPGNGPDHLEFYQKVQKAGRGLDIAVSSDNIEFVIRHLKPEGLHISTSVQSIQEAEELLENACQWAGSHIKQTVL